jgi:NADPH-dependent 2,4-dienoyl-CoA reductase/sulfur reductase-like enzyme
VDATLSVAAGVCLIFIGVQRRFHGSCKFSWSINMLLQQSLVGANAICNTHYKRLFNRQVACRSTTPMHVDVAIAGAGPAGLAAAAALQRADPKLKVATDSLYHTFCMQYLSDEFVGRVG